MFLLLLLTLVHPFDGELTFKHSLVGSTEVLDFGSSLGEFLFKLLLGVLHLLELVLLLGLKNLQVGIKLRLLVLVLLFVDVAHQTVGQILLEDLLLLLLLRLSQELKSFTLAIHSTCLDISSQLTFFFPEFIFNCSDLSVDVNLDFLSLSIVLLDLLGLNSAPLDNFDSSKLVFSSFARGLLLGDLLFHHGQNLFLQLDGLLLIEFQEHVLQLFLMLVIDESLNGSGDLLGCHVELHVLDDLFEGGLTHSITVDSEFI